jgi:multicomponent Na+:H+ antiporter subunit B
MKKHLILRVVSKLLIPLIILYGFYVQFHGDFGAGGGFQAGVIIAVSVILYALIFGMDAAQEAVPPWLIKVGTASGVIVFAGVGFITMLMGGNFLDYDVLHPDIAHRAGQHMGILWVEIGVLLTVTSVMIAVFYAFAGRVPDMSDEEW